MNGTLWVAVGTFPFAGVLAWWSMRDWKRSARRVRREETQAFQEQTAMWGTLRDAEYRLAVDIGVKRGSVSAIFQKYVDELNKAFEGFSS